MYSINPRCTSSASDNGSSPSIARSEFTTVDAMSLNGCARPVPRMQIPDFFDHPEKSGIFNLGTGRAPPFNDIAWTGVNSLRAIEGEEPVSVAELVQRGLIEYIPFPDALRGKYQCFTQANQSKLREAGYDAPFLTVQEGVNRYVRWLFGQL